jgi:DNA-binding response OmpR family regulator
MHLLVVEDEPKIADVVRRGLLDEGYAVDVAQDGAEALYSIEVNTFDGVILDVMLPKLGGLALCAELRRRHIHLPILLLTAKDSIEDRVAGLDAGADDYLTKPFSFSELAARLRALFRRGNKADPPILVFDDLSLNPATKVAERDGERIALTTREYALLEYFMRHPNRILTKTELLEHVWDYNYTGLSNIIETYVKYLRKKLQVSAESPNLIQTMRGSGYILKVETRV